jgi:O-methyltransferase
MRLFEKARTLGRALRGSSHDRYLLAERIAAGLHRDAVLPEVGRVWLRDAEFKAIYERFQGDRYPRRMDRVWLVDQFARAAARLDGDTAECGVHLGLSSYVMCRRIAESGKVHHAFDSFEGLSAPRSEDGSHWATGDLSVAESTARRNLAEFPFVEYHVGWLPGTLSDVPAQSSFALVHLDLDLYDPTLACLEFFAQRITPGGAIIVDDYGLDTCPGVRAAVDEHCARTGDLALDLPTGQALLLSAR